MLGAILAILSAATFALNNAAARRGVVTGTPNQGMAITIPIGVVCFLAIVVGAGHLTTLLNFPPHAAAWMSGVGVVHFIFGRYCNYRANQAAGVNLTAPVIQCQSVVALALAVIILGEPCTLLQMLGGVMMLGGAFMTQQQVSRPRAAKAAPIGASGVAAASPPVFVPRPVAGYTFATLAALCYGTTPILARTALEHSTPITGIAGGVIAYAAAGVVVAALLLWPPIRRDVAALKRENIRWFVYSGIFVAAAQGFFFAAVAIAPVLLVMPLLQLSLVFRLLFSQWLNPDHEVFGFLVMCGAAISIVGACAVSIDSAAIVHVLAAPDAVARVLLWRI